jgi:hypothetical protein
VEQRSAALSGFLSTLSGVEREVLITAVADQDPTLPPPPPEENQEQGTGARLVRAAHLGDLGSVSEHGRYLWTPWLVRGHFNLLTSDPKVGKTHLALDLARRIWFGLPWPDSQDPTLPPGTATLWICGDRHQDELRERAPAFGLPLEAIWLNARPEQPYGGCDLDQPQTHQQLRSIVELGRPALVVIDTMWRATNRRLCREDEANAVVGPLITLAQDCGLAILGLMHLSKDNETLGRRLDGVARSILKLIQPEGATLNRRRLECRGNFKEPPLLGVTLKDDGCEYDANPPGDGPRNLGGRPSTDRDRVAQFVRESLDRENDQLASDLGAQWVLGGGSLKTFWRAVNELCESGEVAAEGGRGKGKRMILHRVEEDPSPVLPFRSIVSGQNLSSHTPGGFVPNRSSPQAVGWVEPQRGATTASRRCPTGIQRHALGGPHDLRSFDPPYVLVIPRH